MNNQTILSILFSLTYLYCPQLCLAQGGSNVECVEEVCRTIGSEIEAALIDLTSAVNRYEYVRTMPTSRSLDLIENELTAASDAVTNAVQKCTQLLAKQQQIGQSLQAILNANIQEQQLLHDRIITLEQEIQIKTNILQKLFSLLDQMCVQLKIYSEYMRSLDVAVCDLITQQNEINQRITASTAAS